jgi:hypothetical protein
MAKHLDILPYLTERRRLGGEEHRGKMVNGTYQNGNYIGGGTYQNANCPETMVGLPCLERLLIRRGKETKAAAQGYGFVGRSQEHIIATCGSVELYVNILVAHQAEIDLQNFIRHTTVANEYEEKLETQRFLSGRSEELHCIYVMP